MATDDVRFEVVGRVARVTMNRPQYRNAQSAQLLDALDGAFAQAAADDNIRVIVLAGEGEAFSAGHDLGTPDQVEALARQAARPASSRR
jgi:enoyl-CoA hydratase